MSPSGANSSTSANQVQRPAWLAAAISSGAFAAFNGLLAKLTTASATHTLASSTSRLIYGTSTSNPSLELVFRALFFGLNLLSNAVMWTLFTRALAAATSTTRVSIINTSANFVVTALLGVLVFGERLPLLWWGGAALLMIGSVIIGARDGEGEGKVADKGEVLVSGEGRRSEDVVNATPGASAVEKQVVNAGSVRKARRRRA